MDGERARGGTWAGLASQNAVSETSDCGRTGDLRHRSYDYASYEGRDWTFFEQLFTETRWMYPILDLGSGLGFFLECCQRRNAPAVGAELSAEGIAISVQKRLPVVRTDLTGPFPFRDGVFGSALAFNLLEHVDLDQERFILREVRRVLRPGGFFYVESPNLYHPNAHKNPDHVNLFTPHELRKELRTAGFVRVGLGTNYWRSVWPSSVPLGRLGAYLPGVLWKVAPIDRFAWNASAIAWKEGGTSVEARRSWVRHRVTSRLRPSAAERPVPATRT